MNAFDHPLQNRLAILAPSTSKRGDLVVEGNVYTHVDIAKIADQHPPVPTPEVDHHEIPSFEVRELEAKADDGE